MATSWQKVVRTGYTVTSASLGHVAVKAILVLMCLLSAVSGRGSCAVKVFAASLSTKVPDPKLRERVEL